MPAASPARTSDRALAWRRLRQRAPAALVVVLLIAGGGVAYLTRHPTSPVLAAAAEWPVVGPVATRFRERYLPPPTPPAAVTAPGEVGEPSPATVVAAPPRPRHDPGALPTVWVDAGTPLRDAPRSDAEAIGELPAIANVPVLERRGDWFRVARRGVEGWVHLPGYDDRDPPLGLATEPVLPLPPRPPDPAALQAARDRLGPVATDGALGPYALHTDVADAALVARLGRLAGAIDGVYRERYGLEPLGTPRAAVVLYRDEDAYRRLQGSTERIAGLTAAGHSAWGLAVLFRGDRTDDEVAGTLVHELVHLVNRRALGPALPPWLDEGLADDLALSAIDSEGRLDPTRLSGAPTVHDDGRVVFDRGVAGLLTLRDAFAARAAPRLSELLALDWRGFVASEASRLHYAEAALFVRWLLHGEGGRRAPRFRAWLAGVAAGQPATPESLAEPLGQPWPVLEASFRQWVAYEADRAVAATGARRYEVVETVPLPARGRP